MFGFSLGKLTILVAIILAIWFGFKWVGKLEADRKEKLRQAAREGTQGGKTAGKSGGKFGGRWGRKASRDDGEIQEMVKDPKTGAYVPKDSLKKG